MITVENLTKYYGPMLALDGISFEVPTGQVLGFLGPNGAGKSTTMKILTGYLYASSGRADVDKIDVLTNPLEVRKRVGYLPETNPLYADMRVDDYLKFVAQIRGVAASGVKSAIERVVEVCGLKPVFKKGIMELSKGFRQRVGLAQAMIHDPQILILDEPTSGLDPNQIIEIRELIRSLGANRTVILSTHYLQEVEATCDRILIIARGRIVADGSAAELCSTLPNQSLTIEIAGPTETVGTVLREDFAHVETLPLGTAGHPRFRIAFEEQAARDPRERVCDIAAKQGWKLLEMRRDGASLEDVFRHLTAHPSPEPVVAAAAAGGSDA